MIDDAVSVSSASSSVTRFSAVRAMFTAKERFNFLSFLFNVPTAAFVSIAFAVTGLGVGTWSWLSLERNLNPTDLLPQDSYVIPFLNSFVAGKMDRFPQFVQYIFEDVDFTNPSHRADIIRVYQDALEIPEHEFEGKTIRISPSVLNPGNIKYLQQNYPSEIIDEKNPTFRIDGEPLTVEDWLLENPGFRESFNRTSDGKYFTKFALTVYTVGEYDTKSRHRMQLLDTANRSLPDGESELKLHLYEAEFSAIDRFLSLDAYFFDVLLSSILGVFTVTLFFTLPMYALVSTFIVVLVICWILLIFPLGGIDYNTILVLNLVMAIGFAVDYCAHIGQCFANNAHLAPKPRALLAINTMAGSVLKAGFSTILAVSCLVFAKGQIALILLKCFVMMVCMGLLHALVFLPSVLFLLATIYNKMVPAKVEDSPPTIEDGTTDSAERSRTTKTMARPGAVPHVRRNLSEAII